MQHLNFTSIHFIYSLYDRCLIFAENLKLSCAQTLVELNHFCWLSLMLEYHDLMLLFFDIQLIIESFQIITISAKIVRHYLWTACVKNGMNLTQCWQCVCQAVVLIPDWLILLLVSTHSHTVGPQHTNCVASILCCTRLPASQQQTPSTPILSASTIL